MTVSLDYIFIIAHLCAVVNRLFNFFLRFVREITPSDFSFSSQGRYRKGLATECLSFSLTLYANYTIRLWYCQGVFLVSEIFFIEPRTKRPRGHFFFWAVSPLDNYHYSRLFAKRKMANYTK